jgi:hypothetical protein
MFLGGGGIGGIGDGDTKSCRRYDMRRLVIVVAGLAVVAVLGAAAVFAIWPVVGDAPWLESKQTVSSDVNVLSWEQVVDAVILRVAAWCRDRQAADTAQCITSDLGGPECETQHDETVWDVYYRDDRRIWVATCQGHIFLVDDNTGQVSGPWLP